jgi:hypothetical protein
MASWFETHFTYCLFTCKFCIEHIALYKLNHKVPLSGDEKDQFGPNRDEIQNRNLNV